MKLALAALALLVAEPASAHAMLEHATPSADATVKAPKEVVLQYSEGLEPTFSKAEVRGADGSMVSDAATVNDTQMRLKMKALSPGHYKVTWHAVSVDTHRSEGSFTFTVKP